MCSVPIVLTARALLEEPLHHVAVAGQLAVDHLERDLRADQRVLRQIDGAHPASADVRQDAVIADRLSGGDHGRAPIVSAERVPASSLERGRNT